MKEPAGLCYRCDFRAQFHEAGHAPRMECSEIGKAICSCYQYSPVKPFRLVKNAEDKRPQFAGAMFSSRSRAAGITDLRLNLNETKEGSTLYWTPKALDEVHLKARDALYFLESHPALGSPVFTPFFLLNLQIAQVCFNKTLEPRKGLVTVYYNPVNYKKFKKEFDKEFLECSEEELKAHKSLISVDVPYKDVYGVEWQPHHIEYWGELDFVVFMGKKFDCSLDSKKWQHLSGINACGVTFQEMVINLAEKFKKTFGNFNSQKLMTAKEKANNKGKMPFIFKPAPKKMSHLGSTMKRNPNYIHIDPSEFNRRWVKWFSQTPYGKKQWGETLQAVLSGKDSIQ